MKSGGWPAPDLGALEGTLRTKSSRTQEGFGTQSSTNKMCPGLGTLCGVWENREAGSKSHIRSGHGSIYLQS